MKFGRYLEETLIPEWKKAYINYRGLKKIISAIQTRDEDDQPLLTADNSPRSPRPDSVDSDDRPAPPPPSHARTPGKTYGSLGQTPPLRPAPEPHALDGPGARRPGEDQRPRAMSTAAEWQGNGATAPSGASVKSTMSLRQRLSSFRGSRPVSVRTTKNAPTNLSDLRANLSPTEKLFFEALDRELDKVDTFYKQHSKDATQRAEVLKEQLRELAEHRKVYYAAHPVDGALWPGYATVHALGEAMGIPHIRQEILHHQSAHHVQQRHELDPEEYRTAQKKLKKAMREYYRGLELLDNYRILNLTGFRKALKKFEKVTGVQYAQQYYMDEKVEPCSFTSSRLLRELREGVEANYAARFEKGDRKAAKDKLRADATPKTQHFSVFRAGLYLGAGIPPLVSGLRKSFDPAVRAQIPQWGPLLQVYSALVIPPVFALLVGLNLIAWSAARINWVFIFELDLKSAKSYRRYFELPCFLFMTLCYAFYFSFSQIGIRLVPPTTWPLVWLVFAIALLVNPFPIISAPSRLWFVRTAGKLLISGTTRVEFADFWMGDQFCSLSYTMANLYVMSCAYDDDWNNVYAYCNAANSWLPAFLSALPGLARFAQCIKRWADSSLKIHLVNAGKYLSTSIVYALYYYWRHRGAGRDFSFVLWCLFATIGSTYTSCWDLLMDWSVMRPNASHIFLREEIIYTNYTYAYYFAIVSNVVIRFIWVFYIPRNGLDPSLRGFIFAFLEVLRRWQWNFYRVENEHIGNADRYRVTREIPLPYAMDEDDQKEGDISDEEGPIGSAASTKSKKSRPWGPPMMLRNISQSLSVMTSEGGAHGPQDARDYVRDNLSSQREAEAAAVRSIS